MQNLPNSPTWRDTITVEGCFLRELLSLGQRLLLRLLCLFRGPKPPTALLVHLRPRSHTINSQEEQFLWFDLFKEMIDICEDRGEYLFLCDPEVGILVIGM
jgi:hypothetical protein